MDFVLTQTYLGDILHGISQALLAPDVILLIAFIAYSIWCIGSVVVEGLTERRNFKQASPKFLSRLVDSSPADVPQVIADSELLNRQKIALLTVFDYRTLPGDALLALTRKLVAREELRYNRIIGRNEMGVKAAPMLGLMGTLIPLGPGIAALGTGNIDALASSIVVAFDTTVAGLATAFVCLAVVKIRRNWYEAYMTEFDSAMATMLQKIRDMRKDGQLEGVKPTDHAQRYAAALKRSSSKQADAARSAADALAGGEPRSEAPGSGAAAPDAADAAEGSKDSDGVLFKAAEATQKE